MPFAVVFFLVGFVVLSIVTNVGFALGTAMLLIGIKEI
jgi:hypothetical protein